MNLIKNNILIWYRNNLGKIVFLLAATVISTLTMAYVPYLNIIIPSSVRFLAVFLIWYILFSPSNILLIFFSIILLIIAAIVALIELDSLAETFGIVIYLSLILVFINDIKNFFSKKQRNPTIK